MNKMNKKTIFGLSINIFLLGIVSLLTDFSSEMINSVLPVFIMSIGGTGIALGLVGGISESVANFLKLVSGIISDKIHQRKKLVIAGYGLSSVSKLFLPLVSTWKQLILFKIVERTGKGLRDSPRDALISKYIDRSKSGRAYGLHQSLDTLGAILGSIASLVLVTYIGLTYKSLFLVAAILAFTALIPLIMVEDVKDKLKNEKKEKISLRYLSKETKLLIFVFTLSTLGMISYMFFYSYYISISGEMTISVIRNAISLYILFNIVYSFFAYRAGKLSEKFSKSKILTTGYIIFGIVSLLFALTHNIYVLIAGFALFGLSIAFIKPIQRAMISDASAKSLKGSAFGLYYFSIGTAALIGNGIAGLLVDKFSYTYAFLFSSSLMFLSALLLLLFSDKFT
ncbi:MAG: MFS transporter [Candidatus Aenigmarchaeota archaeon]|nr:MFS transporter [Candidatus Aenigmarchaeota archaeon]